MHAVVEPVVVAPAPQWSSKVSRAPERYLFLTTEQHDVLLLDNDEPKDYTKAMVGPDSKKWLKAMGSEIKSMYDNQVWNLVDHPDGVKAIECKRVFKKKTNTDENV